MKLKFWPTLFKSLNAIMLMPTHFMLKTVFRMEKQVFHTNSIRLVKFAVQLLCRTENVLRPVLSKCVSRNSEAMRSLQRSAKRKNVFIVICLFFSFENLYTWDFQKECGSWWHHCSAAIWHVHLRAPAVYETSSLLTHKQWSFQIACP